MTANEPSHQDVHVRFGLVLPRLLCIVQGTAADFAAWVKVEIGRWGPTRLRALPEDQQFLQQLEPDGDRSYRLVLWDQAHGNPEQPELIFGLTEGSGVVEIDGQCFGSFGGKYADFLAAMERRFPEAQSEIGLHRNSVFSNGNASSILAPIPDELDGKLRVMVERYREGDTAAKIAGDLGYAPKTVQNQLTDARHRYGPEVVPKHRD
jgi:hypothetical protein